MNRDAHDPAPHGLIERDAAQRRRAQRRRAQRRRAQRRAAKRTSIQRRLAQGRAQSPGRASRTPADSGRAIIEVVFLAVLLLIPTVYILINVLRLQAATLAVTQSARDVGRLIETSTYLPTVDQINVVARIALQDQHLDTTKMHVVTTGRGEPCDVSTTTLVSREPGSDYDVCVIAIVDLPGVPTVLTGSKNTVTGVYGVHIDQIREGN
ncbi:MAG: hypothetical protein ABI382_04910 [Nakamurella sp.]